METDGRAPHFLLLSFCHGGHSGTWEAKIGAERPPFLPAGSHTATLGSCPRKLSERSAKSHSSLGLPLIMRFNRMGPAVKRYEGGDRKSAALFAHIALLGLENPLFFRGRKHGLAPAKETTSNGDRGNGTWLSAPDGDDPSSRSQTGM